jgi:hypothetical protein
MSRKDIKKGRMSRKEGCQRRKDVKDGRTSMKEGYKGRKKGGKEGMKE